MADRPKVIALRLRHPDLVFHVDVTLTEHEGRWLAVTMLADEPDIGTGDDPREALRVVWRRWVSRSPPRWRAMRGSRMDELERYLARRRRRRLFALTIRDQAQSHRWARLGFDATISIITVNGRVNEELSDRSGDLRLSVEGSGLADVEDRMAALGWTGGHRGDSDQRYGFRRPRPPEDEAAPYAAIARGAAAAVLGTDRYRLTIEPHQGENPLYLSEAAGYHSLITMAGFVVGAPIAILLALWVGSFLEVALVGSLLLAMAALYRTRLYAFDEARLRFLAHLSESALVELPIVGSLVEGAIGWAAMSISLWLPILVALVITRPEPPAATPHLLLVVAIVALTIWAVTRIRRMARFGLEQEAGRDGAGGRHDLPASPRSDHTVTLVSSFFFGAMQGLAASRIAADPARYQGREALAVLIALVVLSAIAVLAAWWSRSWRMGLAAAALAALGFLLGLVVGLVPGLRGLAVS